MELKPYQQQVIDDLSNYLNILKETPYLPHAFKRYWDEKGVTRMDAYKDNVPYVPHVCAKVPTAGGKTYIAVNAIKTIIDSFLSYQPERVQLVVWLVPSLTILEQTVKNLSDPAHPYRKRLNQLFRNRVSIYEKRDLLMGAGFSADTIKEQLSVVVMSFDSLRAKNKEDRKIFQENGYLSSFTNHADTNQADELLTQYDPTSLINVIRRLKPIVIVDESHNAESQLSVEMLENLNPYFIFDLTATPKKNSNIISYVDAMALKRHHMVKLPVIVANQSTRMEVIESAIVLQRQLEKLAISEEQAGGKYIRPIVLFQAQPRTDDDQATYEKVKEHLISLKIPDEQIKIKTANINELDGINLLNRDCSVRYIITVNALKEGWDCPFAYILASLGDKSSAVDVEQILGRVLRMPHVQQHTHDLLNLSFVLTASSKFMHTLQSIVQALNRAGFSEKDFRALDTESLPERLTSVETEQNYPLLAETIDHSDAFKRHYEGRPPLENPAWRTRETPAENATAPVINAASFVEKLKTRAIAENKDFEEKANEKADFDIPVALEAKMNIHRIKEIYCTDAQKLRLPQFHIGVRTGGWFDEESASQLFERDELLRDFKLSQSDANVSFEDIDSQMYRVDLEIVGEQNYAPKPFKIDSAGRQRFNSIILAGSRQSQIKNATARLAFLVGNMYPITDPEIEKYIYRIVESMGPEQIRDCLERDIAYVRKIKQKISALADIHAYKTFIDLIDVDKIVLQPSFQLPITISPSANAPSLPKSLYSTEASMGNFEARVINEIANLDSIEWWHRNLSRGKGFRLNGFINHYPDFLLKTKLGRIIALETKGDDRDNTDSELKLKLGKLWESKADGSTKYMMVFDTNPIKGAERLSDAINKLRQL